MGAQSYWAYVPKGIGQPVAEGEVFLLPEYRNGFQRLEICSNSCIFQR
jgi:hypothetical protein